MQILFIENVKCKYFRKVFKMHLNVFAFDPMSGGGSPEKIETNYGYEWWTWGWGCLNIALGLHQHKVPRQ